MTHGKKKNKTKKNQNNAILSKVYDISLTNYL